MPKASSSELMRGAAAQLIRSMEQKGIVWWIYDGYSIRRMHQTELVMDSEEVEVKDDGSRSEDHVGEPEQEPRDDREGEAGVAAEDDGGVRERGTPGRLGPQRALTIAKSLAAKTKARFAARPRYRPRRRSTRRR